MAHIRMTSPKSCSGQSHAGCPQARERLGGQSCLYICGFIIMYKNRKSSRESIQLDPVLGPFQTSPTPLCKQETKATIYEADWNAQGCPDISHSLLSFLFLKALSQALILSPLFFDFPFQSSSSSSFFFFLTQEQKLVPVQARWPGAEECGRSLGTGWPGPGAHSGWQARSWGGSGTLFRGAGKHYRR